MTDAPPVADAARLLEVVEGLAAVSDLQAFLDGLARAVAETAGYAISVLTVHLPEGGLLGASGITDEERARFLKSMERSHPGRRRWKRDRILEMCYPGTGIAYVPHTANLPRSAAFQPSRPPSASGSWHPDDRLFILVKARAGEDFGVLSLDEPRDGQAPSEATLDRLRVSERLLGLGATLLEGRLHARDLERAQRLEAVGTLTSGIAHDFNNLLTGILGYSALLGARVEGDPESRRMVRSIEESASRAADLTRGLLGLVRPVRGEARPIEVAPVLKEVVQFVRETFDRRIEVEFSVDPDLPAVRVGPGDLHRAVLNLCINARDAMPEGGLLSVTGARDSRGPRTPGTTAPPGGWVLVEVRDTGRGMDEGVQARIFQPFFSTKGRGEGTGLGLYVVHKIATAFGGKVTVSSRPLSGTTIRLWFPVAAAEAPEGAAAAEVGSPRATEAPRGPTGRILVVEDEDLVRRLTVETLRLDDHTVDSVEDGEAAIERLSIPDANYDLVVLDLILPRVSGEEVFRRLRALRPDLPVIVSSGTAHEGLADPVVRAGAAEVLAKPYPPEALRAAVRRVLSARPRPS